MTVRWNPSPAASICARQAAITAATQRAELILGAGRLVLAAARCWRMARDGRASVQQCLYMMLSPHEWGMLAPVFASLMTLCEAALGRPIAVGGASLSEDECLLLGLLDGSKSRRVCIDCAICSTRIMMTLTKDGPIGYPAHQFYPAGVRLTIPALRT